MVISQGEVWWADLPAPAGSGPGFRRPVVVVQGDALNRSRIATVVCVPLTSNLRWALAPGNVHLSARHTGLPKAETCRLSSRDQFAVKKPVPSSFGGFNHHMALQDIQERGWSTVIKESALTFVDR